MQRLINHSAKKMGICWIIQAALSCYYSGMLGSNSGGSCALPPPPIFLPPTPPSSAASIQLFVQPCSEMIQESGKGGGGGRKAKVNPNLTPFSEILPLPQGEKTRRATKQKSRSKGNLFNHICNRQVSKVELQYPLSTLVSGWKALSCSPSSISITPKIRRRVAASR